MSTRRRKVYRPYQGSLDANRWPALSIIRLETRLSLRKPWVRRLLIGAGIPLLFMTALLYFNVVIEGRTRARILDLKVYTNLYKAEILFLMLLMAAAGSGSIARDVASRAHQLYFSRPLTSLQYCLGKTLSLCLLFSIGFVVPGLALCAIDLALSSEPDLAAFGLKLVQVGGYALLLSAVTACLIACLSSFGKRSRAIGMIWVGVYIFSSVVARLLARRDLEHWANLLSIQHLFRQCGLAFFASEEATHGGAAVAIVGLLGVASFGLLYWRIRDLQRREGT